MTRTVLFVVLDAFRGDYLDATRTPFLWQLAQRGVWVQRARTASGFTQRTAIFTGAWGDVTGLWTMHAYDPQRSPFRFLRGARWPFWVDAVCSRIPGMAGRVLEARFRSAIYRTARQYARHPAPARIPLHLLPHFAVTEDEHPIEDPGSCGVPSVMDSLHGAGVPFQYLMYPEVDGTDQSTEAALVRAARSDHAAIFGLLSDADLVGHRHGPQAPETAQATTRLDQRLQRIDAAFRAAGREPTWLVVGDHGMLEVTSRVDVRAHLRARARGQGLREGRDYLVFCDSTAVKLWALVPAAEHFLEDAFSGLEPHGRVLDAQIARTRRIPFGDRRWGDRAWLANPGVLVWPDFFHRKDDHVRGMHGYDPAVEGQKGIAVVSGPGIAARTIDEAPIVDVCPTLCELLQVPVPARNEGQSWVAAAALAHA